MGESKADGGSHERRGARGGDDGGEDSCEEAAGVALFLCEFAADAGEGEADVEESGEREGEEEDAGGEEGEEDGGLELEAPSGLTSAGSQGEQDSDDDPEGDEDAEGVDEAVAAEMLALLAGGLQEGESFEEEDGEDAGHQVEDDAAEERQAYGGKRGDAAGRCAGSGGVGGSGDFAGRDGSGDVVGDFVGEFEDAVKSRGEGLEIFGAADSEADAVGKGFDLLRRSVGDLFLIEGVELGVGLALPGGKGEDEVGLTADDGELCVRGQRLGDEGEGFAEGADGLRGSGVGRDGEV